MRAKDDSPCFVGQSAGTDVARSQTGADGIDYEADVKDGEGHCVADEGGDSKRDCGCCIAALLMRGKG